MTPATKALLVAIVRHVRGALTDVDKWLDAQCKESEKATS